MPEEKQAKSKVHITVPVAIALVFVAAVVGAMAAITVQRVEARSEPEPAAIPAEAESQHDAPEDWQAEPLDDPFELLGSDEWNPFQEMQAMQERMDKLFNDSWMRLNRSPMRNFSTPSQRLTTAPSVDLTEQADEYVVHVDMPGLEDGNANVTLEDGQLGITGSRVDVVEDTSGGQVIRKERRATHFARTIALPDPVDPGGMTTAYENGVLTIRIPKLESSSSSPEEPSAQ